MSLRAKHCAVKTTSTIQDRRSDLAEPTAEPVVGIASGPGVTLHGRGGSRIGSHHFELLIGWDGHTSLLSLE